MTFFKEKTIELIEKLPEEKMAYIYNILQNIDAIVGDNGEEEDAFAALMTFHKKARDLSAEDRMEKVEMKI